MPDDVGVGEAAILADDRGVAGHGIAERAEQRLARCALQLPLRGVHIAVAVAHLAVRHREGVDHAVAGEPVIIGVARLELRIGTVAIEGAGKPLWDFADDFQIREIVLTPHGSKIASEIGIAGFDLDRGVHGGPPSSRPLAASTTYTL